ncbi:MAG: Tethering factor for nuclear proteasome sts1 [Thelocarpon impressellum]|nr:MAG: Tethering factor for nuclear proteasome sts1 [Thelocarpon impressellum]
MNTLLFSPSAFPPHLHANARHSPTRSASTQASTISSRKRKADDDDGGDYGQGRSRSRESSSSGDVDDRMSASPSHSPAMAARSLPRLRHKRVRPNVTGRALALPRLLETMDAQALRTMLQSVCERHPDVGTEVVSTAPRPTVLSALDILSKYESSLRASFPFGGSATSNYAYDRVQQALTALLDALEDFTPHFLPPNESQATVSLSFLDAATDMVHRLPAWDDPQHNHHKNSAYEEISKAWALVVREAAKRGGGIQLQYGGWDQKLAKHNENAEGRMQGAVDELKRSLGWMGGPQGPGSEDLASVRQQLLSGTYGSNPSVRVGPW